MEDLITVLKTQIIDTLNLEDIASEDIDPEAPLFGEGLGLDSLDALELVVMIEKEYGIKITDIKTGRRALASVSAMARFIQEHRSP